MAKFKLEDFKPKKAADVGTPRSILLFGNPKTGKSVTAASIVDVPGYERVLVIDVEGGAISLSQWYPEVDVVEVDTVEAFDGLLEALVNGKIVEPESGLPYQAVVIDTLDKAFDRKLEWADNQPEAFSNNSGKKDHFYKWAVVKAWMLKLSDLAHMAPFLTIFVAHSMVDKNEDTGKVLETVSLGGSSKFTFAGTPDIVGYQTITKRKGQDPVRSLDFTINDKRITGQRFAGKLDGVMEDPTMEKIYRAVAPQIFENQEATN